MTRVFIGGSRASSRLDTEVLQRLERLCRRDIAVLIGDADGVDKAVQAFLARRRYPRVTVYCSNGLCRNNVGNWTVDAIQTVAKPGSRAFFSAKDRAMARDATYGLMMWNGRSKGTLNNIENLVEQGKPVVVFMTTERSFYTVRRPADVHSLPQHHEPSRASRRHAG
jgi:hypothetical protein